MACQIYFREKVEKFFKRLKMRKIEVVNIAKRVGAA